jgi:hypothetical protein
MFFPQPYGVVVVYISKDNLHKATKQTPYRRHDLLASACVLERTIQLLIISVCSPSPFWSLLRDSRTSNRTVIPALDALVVRSSVSQSKSLGRVTDEWIFSLFLPYVSRNLTSWIFMVHSPANRGLSDLVINAS